MLGTRKTFRVSWSPEDSSFNEEEFASKLEAVKFADRRINEGVNYLSIDEVEIDFDEDGDFGESGICIYLHQAK